MLGISKMFKSINYALLSALSDKYLQSVCKWRAWFWCWYVRVSRAYLLIYLWSWSNIRTTCFVVFIAHFWHTQMVCNTSEKGIFYIPYLLIRSCLKVHWTSKGTLTGNVKGDMIWNLKGTLRWHFKEKPKGHFKGLERNVKGTVVDI